MKIIIRLYFTLVATTLFLSCDSKKHNLNETYYGSWMETEWKYIFKDNGRFLFRSDGHYGNVTDSGNYFLKDSILILNPETDWRVRHGVLMTRLKIIDLGCLRDYSNNYYCKSIEQIDDLNDREFTFQSEMKEVIDSLQVVKSEKERLSSYRKEGEEYQFEIEYHGIVLINKKEYHQFGLCEHRMFDTNCYLDFLITKSPFAIYQHISRADSLVLVLKRQ